eukprot:scaffold96944_cov26-Tisochrysis_lutea.AAC.3
MTSPCSVASSIRASRHCGGKTPASNSESDTDMPVVPLSITATAGRPRRMVWPLTTRLDTRAA